MSYVSSMSTASSALSSLSTLKGGEVKVEMENSTAVMVAAGSVLAYYNVDWKKKDWTNKESLYMVIGMALVYAMRDRLPKGSASAAAGAVSGYAAAMAIKHMTGKPMAEYFGFTKSKEVAVYFDYGAAVAGGVFGMYMAGGM